MTASVAVAPRASASSTNSGVAPLLSQYVAVYDEARILLAGCLSLKWELWWHGQRRLTKDIVTLVIGPVILRPSISSFYVTCSTITELVMVFCKIPTILSSMIVWVSIYLSSDLSKIEPKWQSLWGLLSLSPKAHSIWRSLNEDQVTSVSLSGHGPNQGLQVGFQNHTTMCEGMVLRCCNHSSYDGAPSFQVATQTLNVYYGGVITCQGR